MNEINKKKHLISSVRILYKTILIETIKEKKTKISTKKGKNLQ